MLYKKIPMGPSHLMFPIPASLVVTGQSNDLNVAAVAWIGMMTYSPPIVTISLKEGRHSLDLIRKYKEFTVNLPSAEHYKETDYCGLVSGSDENKLETIGFSTEDSLNIKTPIIKECPYNMECKVVKEVTIDCWQLVFGEIVETHIDESVCKNDGSIDVNKLNPLVYLAQIKEYWTIGNKLGDVKTSGEHFTKKP
ncbi:flavin reductase family protein [bacterium]|nr:flavin reductase family protein [bacterium]